MRTAGARTKITARRILPNQPVARLALAAAMADNAKKSKSKSPPKKSKSKSPPRPAAAAASPKHRRSPSPKPTITFERAMSQLDEFFDHLPKAAQTARRRDELHVIKRNLRRAAGGPV
jgi:hypothetical protein